MCSTACGSCDSCVNQGMLESENEELRAYLEEAATLIHNQVERRPMGPWAEAARKWLTDLGQDYRIGPLTKEVDARAT